MYTDLWPVIKLRDLRSSIAKKMSITYTELSQVHRRAFSDISRFIHKKEFNHSSYFLFISTTDKEKKLDTDVEGSMY